MTHDPEIATLRRQLSAHHDRRRKRSFPDFAKLAATQLARSRQRDGHSIASTARSLGIPPVALGSWLRRDARSAADAFAPVVSADAPDEHDGRHAFAAGAAHRGALDRAVGRARARAALIALDSRTRVWLHREQVDMHKQCDPLWALATHATHAMKRNVFDGEPTRYRL